MIVTRTPLRIPLGGGGTDLPPYYSEYGGFVVSAAINKYVYITVHQQVEKTIRISYSRTENVSCVDDIEHPIVREALKLTGLGPGLEIVSLADLPSNTGLGSSGAFAVGLLQALHAFKRENVGPQQLAEEAFHIEAELIGDPVGKQDQYIAAYGHITKFEIEPDGSVHATRMNLREDVLEQLENDTMLFYTGLKRSASEVLTSQKQNLQRREAGVAESLHEIKAIGYKIATALEEGNLASFGRLLDSHWQAKKRTSGLITTSDVDCWYDLAMSNGVLGGKLMGAGGGGFLMFYCPNPYRTSLRKAMANAGLTEMRFALDQAGSTVILNF